MSRITILICLVAIALLGTNAFATTWPQLKLAELYEHSDTVAFVRINSATIVPGSIDSEYHCGVRYTGVVTKSFKAPPTQKTSIDFGRYIGLDVGREYLLFLNDGEPYEPMMSIGSNQAKQRAEWEKWSYANCESMPRLEVNFGGRGALPVIWTLRWKSLGSVDGVLAPNRYIKFPVQVPKGPFGDDDETYPFEHSEWTVGSREKLEKVLEALSEGQ